ncbi:MAG: hypothetical protein M3160_01145 [Candidatus Eremiobacteraeota bacterium]|nr:hypothetical protein [Candidatus Eremiobacteraeota bacterium]
MNRVTLNAAAICAVGDTLYGCGCKNPYRAILSAVSRGFDPQEVENAYLRRSRGEALDDAEGTLLSTFDAIVRESTAQIELLGRDLPLR